GFHSLATVSALRFLASSSANRDHFHSVSHSLVSVLRFRVHNSSSDFKPSELQKMYADLVENGGRRSVKERINGNGTSGLTRLQ
ncbi:unnamed protein product, partial [Sphenostylis stenocarpa]